MALDREILTVKEVGEALRVHPSTLYRLVREGRIPAFRVGSDWRFRKEGIVRWTVDQTRGGPQ
jgi:excisionase family DNA binding protein